MTERNPRAMGAFRADVARRYAAAPARVFRAWTDAAQARVWLATGGDAIMNAEPGGLFYIGMIYQGVKYPHYGRYLRVEPEKLLEFTWVSEGTKGKESIVTVTFRALPDGGTDVALAHEGLPDEANARDHEGGWGELMDALTSEVA